MYFTTVLHLSLSLFQLSLYSFTFHNIQVSVLLLKPPSHDTPDVATSESIHQAKCWPWCGSWGCVEFLFGSTWVNLITLWTPKIQTFPQIFSYIYIYTFVAYFFPSNSVFTKVSFWTLVTALHSMGLKLMQVCLGWTTCKSHWDSPTISRCCLNYNLNFQQQIMCITQKKTTTQWHWLGSSSDQISNGIPGFPKTLSSKTTS